MESAVLRAEKIAAISPAGAPVIAVTLARLYAAKAMNIVELAARKVVAAAAEGDMLRTQMTILRRLARHDPTDTIPLRRQAAAHVVRAGKYAL
jgi:butyryl-CoA dehydrogenase